MSDLLSFYESTFQRIIPLENAVHSTVRGCLLECKRLVRSCRHTHIHTYIHIRMQILVYKYTHSYIQICLRTNAITYIHTYTVFRRIEQASRVADAVASQLSYRSESISRHERMRSSNTGSFIILFMYVCMYICMCVYTSIHVNKMQY